MDFFQTLAEHDIKRCLSLSDPPSGLQAFIVLDDFTLGPAVGGIRTKSYLSVEEALADASRLSHAMTIKCALAGLEAGGGKAVVLDHDGLNRKLAFARLGKFVEELGGIFQTAGDLGTTPDDIAVMAQHTQFVTSETDSLFTAAGAALVTCLRAAAEVRGIKSLQGLRIAIQGCGAIGSALARALVQEEAEIFVADIDPARAEGLAREVGAKVIEERGIFLAEVDIVSPCAMGGVITQSVASAMRAWGVCGGANNQIADHIAAQTLAKRKVIHVPDVLASAGAVIEGVSKGLMGLPNRDRLIEQLGKTTKAILVESLSSGEDSTSIATRRAFELLRAKAHKT